MHRYIVRVVITTLPCSGDVSTCSTYKAKTGVVSKVVTTLKGFKQKMEQRFLPPFVLPVRQRQEGHEEIDRGVPNQGLDLSLHETLFVRHVGIIGALPGLHLEDQT